MVYTLVYKNREIILKIETLGGLLVYASSGYYSDTYKSLSEDELDLISNTRQEELLKLYIDAREAE